MIDHNVDWVRMYLKINVEAKVDDHNLSQDKLLQDLKDYTLKNIADLQKKSEEATKRVDMVYG